MYKILIVEDDRIIADNVCEQLLKWGYDVKIADDFNDVLKIFAKYEPQLVLMDIGLPYFIWLSLVYADKKYIKGAGYIYVLYV